MQLLKSTQIFWQFMIGISTVVSPLEISLCKSIKPASSWE